MNKTKFSWLVLGAVGVIVSTSGCRGASMNPLSWWRSSSDPAVLADDSTSVPSPSETAMPVQQDGGPAATLASNYPDTGAPAPYAASPYNGSGATASPYAASPVGASTPYGAPAPNSVSTAGVPGTDSAAAYAVPSPYSAGAAPQQPYGQPSSSTPYGQAPVAPPYGQPAATVPYGQAPTTTSAPYGQQPAASSPYGESPTPTYGQPAPSSVPYGSMPTTTYGQPAPGVAPYGQAAPSSDPMPSATYPGTYGAGYNQPATQQAPSMVPYSGASVSPGTSAPMAGDTSPNGVVQASALEGSGGNAVSTAPYLPGSTSRQSNLNPY